MTTNCISRRSKLNPETIRRLTIVACAALLVVPVVMKSCSSVDHPPPAAFRIFSSCMIKVKVGGEVHHTGIYEVPVNTMAVSAINLAEPRRPIDPDLRVPKFAEPLKNGAAVMLRTHPDGSRHLSVENMTVQERLVLGIPLDITTMSDDDFECLPGVGPSLSKRISAYRQKNGGKLRVEELASIEGIGDKKYALLRPCFQPMVNTK